MTEKASRSKVERLIKEYDIAEVGDELEERWTRSNDRYGIRQLADYFNKQLLQRELTMADSGIPDREVEILYRQLTDEEVSSGVRTEARNQLMEGGVDVEQLEEDFLSKQAIHTYLTRVRQAEPPKKTTTASEQRDRDNRTIQRLKQRLIAVTERVLANLKSTDRLTVGEFTVLVNVRVHCSDCGTQIPVSDLLADGVCNCEPAQDGDDGS